MLHFGHNYVKKSTYLEIRGNFRREFEDARFPGIPDGPVSNLMNLFTEIIKQVVLIQYMFMFEANNVLKLEHALFVMLGTSLVINAVVMYDRLCSYVRNNIHWNYINTVLLRAKQLNGAGGNV